MPPAVLIPSTFASGMEKSGPPLLPGLSGAVWGMKSKRLLMSSGSATVPVVAVTPPAELRGKPTATTSVPTAGVAGSHVKALNSNEQHIARTATSLSASHPSVSAWYS